LLVQTSIFVSHFLHHLLRQTSIVVSHLPILCIVWYKPWNSG
jgi:hypothetical protein